MPLGDPILIDALPATAVPTRDHEFPAMDGGLTVKLTVGQVNALTTKADVGLPDVTNLALNHANVTGVLDDDKPASRLSIDAIGNLFKITYITASGTHNYDAAAKYADIEVIGAGGAGGGMTATSGNQGGSGGGGGHGGICRLFKALGAVTSATIVIGAAGTGVSAGTGGTGGASSYTDSGHTLTGNGGAGGTVGGGGLGAYASAGGAGGTATGGTENLTGQGGNPTFGVPGATYALMPGAGASGPHGSGGESSPSTNNVNLTVAGTVGNGYGGGGSGAKVALTGAAKAGGNGLPGLIVIKEYR